MGIGNLPNPVNYVAKSARSKFATGTIYAVQCGWEEWFLVQVAVDATVAMFDQVLSREHLVEIKANGVKTDQLGAIRYRLLFMLDTPTRGKWTRLGRFPLAPTLEQFAAYGSVTGVEGYEPLQFWYLSSDHHTKLEVAEQDWDGREHGIWCHFDGLWKWMTHEPPFLLTKERWSWRRKAVKEIWSQPERFSLFRLLVPEILHVYADPYGPDAPPAIDRVLESFSS